MHFRYDYIFVSWDMWYNIGILKKGGNCYVFIL